MIFTDVLINLRKIVRSVNLESKRIEKEFGISIPQLLCMHFLLGQPNYQATITSIAHYLNLNLSTVMGIVGRLEKKNLVARIPKPGDRRTTLVSLTTAGLQLLERSPELMHQQLSARLDALPEKQLTNLKESLDLLVSCFELDNESASPLMTMDDLKTFSEEGDAV